MDGHRTISVLVVDDHPLYRESAARAVAADRRLALVGEAADGGAALARAAEIHPEAIVLDACLPRPGAEDVLRRLRRISPRRKILLLAQRPGPDLHDAIEACPDSLLYKSCERAEICDEIVAMCDGDERSEGRLLLERARTYAARRPNLRRRDVRVLELKASGFKDGQVAAELNWSRKAVEEKLRAIRHDMGVRTTTQAVAMAYEMGILGLGRSYG